MYNSIMDLEKVCRELRDRNKRIGIHVSQSCVEQRGSPSPQPHPTSASPLAACKDPLPSLPPPPSLSSLQDVQQGITGLTAPPLPPRLP